MRPADSIKYTDKRINIPPRVCATLQPMSSLVLGFEFQVAFPTTGDPHDHYGYWYPGKNSNRLYLAGRQGPGQRQGGGLLTTLGCDIGDNVNRTTMLLVVDDQDIRRLAGHDKSNIQRKAEELIAKGQLIWILGESDFLQLVGM